MNLFNAIVPSDDPQLKKIMQNDQQFQPTKDLLWIFFDEELMLNTPNDHPSMGTKVVVKQHILCTQ